MSPARSMLILTLFFLDVRVRADNKSERDCWGKEIPCAVQAVGRKRELKAGEDLTLVLAGGALAHQRDGTTIQLVDGRFYVEVKRPIAFKTPYATLTCTSECKALINRKEKELSVKSLEGEWTLVRLGDAQVYFLSAGFHLTVGEVETNGLAQMEFPQSLAWAPTILEWSKMYPRSAEVFKSDAGRFRVAWKNAVENASVVHQQVAARAVASHEEGLARERARRKAVEKEEAALRELFRKKNGIDP